MRFITEYKEAWPVGFEAIVELLALYVRVTCKFHHVGSTAVAGMPAKDIIDLVIECPLGSMRQILQALAAAGYVHEGDKGIATREAFRPLPHGLPSELPTHHLYACESSSPELKKHIAFRDYLMVHQDRAEWLANEKRLADSTANSREEYIANKSRAYQIITAESVRWIQASRATD